MRDKKGVIYILTNPSFANNINKLRRMEEFRKAQAEIDKQNPPKPASQVLFKVI